MFLDELCITCTQQMCKCTSHLSKVIFPGMQLLKASLWSYTWTETRSAIMFSALKTDSTSCLSLKLQPVKFFLKVFHKIMSHSSGSCKKCPSIFANLKCQGGFGCKLFKANIFTYQTSSGLIFLPNIDQHFLADGFLRRRQFVPF